MATIIGNKLSARVVLMGKLTNVGIYCGPNRIAAATIGGRWNAAQALGEFKRLPHRFKPSAGLSPEALVNFGKLAA
jgi:hypothetical protein